MQADSIRKLIDDGVAQDQAFTRMFQAFMALGLFVGIAALGVIAFRSVVERRQQIGMLRAIGYQSGTVALTFVLESGFIALMGILSGVVGGAILARNLFTSGQFADDGVEFTMPWTEVIGFAAVAFVFSLLMTVVAQPRRREGAGRGRAALRITSGRLGNEPSPPIRESFHQDRGGCFERPPLCVGATVAATGGGLAAVPGGRRYGWRARSRGRGDGGGRGDTR